MDQENLRPPISEQEAEQLLEDVSSWSLSEIDAFKLDWLAVFRYIFDEDILLSDEEAVLIEFFCLWSIYAHFHSYKVVPVHDLSERLYDEEDRLWSSYEKNEKKFKLIDFLFEECKQEEILAVLEDAFSPDEDGISSKELQQILLLKFEVLINVLNSIESP